MATSNDAIVEEIEALQAIMLDEVTVLHSDSGVPNGVEVTVVPATGQNIEEQYVRVTLVLSLPQDYPDEPPLITLRNPRGVDDYVLSKIHLESKKKCEEYLGCPVIYELIEVIRDNLTANNTPSCPCAICLHGFTAKDVFTKTPCFHYFHSYCLGRYIINCEEEAAAEEEEPTPSWMAREKKQLMCPVCRDPIPQEVSGRELLMSPPPEEDLETLAFSPDDPEIVALQQRMAALYHQQKEKGGIIDLEEEKNKFLLSSSRADSCEGLEESGEGDTASSAIPNEMADTHEQVIAPSAPTTGRRGGRSGYYKPQKSHGSQGRQHWRGADQGGDSRYWQGNPGNRGGGSGRGRGGNVRHGNQRIIGESQQSNKDISQSHVENRSSAKGQAGRREHILQNGSSHGPVDNMTEGPRMVSNTGGGSRRGPKNYGNRSRYGSGRVRERGPPPGYAASGFRYSDQDWS